MHTYILYTYICVHHVYTHALHTNTNKNTQQDYACEHPRACDLLCHERGKDDVDMLWLVELGANRARERATCIVENDEIARLVALESGGKHLKQF